MAGDSVESNYFGEGEYYKGKITTVHSDGTCDILYDDGDNDKEVPSSRIRRPPGPVGRQKFFSYLRRFFAKHKPDTATARVIALGEKYVNNRAALNAKLRKQFGEDIRSFRLHEEFSAQLRLFYAKHNPDHLATGHATAVADNFANNRAGLNERLRAEYGADLESFQQRKPFGRSMHSLGLSAGGIRCVERAKASATASNAGGSVADRLKAARATKCAAKTERPTFSQVAAIAVLQKQLAVERAGLVPSPAAPPPASAAEMLRATIASPQQPAAGTSAPPVVAGQGPTAVSATAAVPLQQAMTLFVGSCRDMGSGGNDARSPKRYVVASGIPTRTPSSGAFGPLATETDAGVP